MTSKYSQKTNAQLLKRIQELESILQTSTPLPIEQSDSSTALRERELRYHSVFETAVEGIITMGEDRLIESINPAAQRMFGYDERELLGKNIKILMPPPHRQNHDNYVRNYLRTSQAKVIGIGRETSGQKKDGTIFPIALSVSEARLPSKRLFTGVIRDLTERKQLEHDILHAADEERRRIAQDLHDGLGSHLSGVAFLCEAMNKDLEARSLRQAIECREILKQVNIAIDQLRDIAHGLHPVEHTRDGLMRSLADLADRHQNAGIECHFECPDAVLLEDTSASNHLFRIAQEALTNALRHGKAKRVSINLTQSNHRITLSIKDNGIGIRSSASLEQQGLGLRTMAYRAGLFGGTLTVQKNKARGTLVLCSFPVT